MASVKNDKANASADATDQAVEPSSDVQTAAGVQFPMAVMVFRDKVYTSRVLILPDERQLKVAAGRVTAAASDEAALTYLRQHPDLEPVPE
ncbi:hypothetical protein [Pseudomonas quasicaspiana]|uniref:hypothetical protein n=1 Tax=Pseudomonas quasicaspiana TaxID=2829821 RepID=UPI001E5FE844|nr:hypothetical protein [Pseudomonas quasicaspiana]MCD5977215.1 hypothetical protein [Pseudomonas quasicaspiana]